ncbi:MAG TPA: hypothetical protein VFL92_10410 [Sphingomonas sp.]|nr:hypothetical protein [Sphingomonas sp.]
MAHVHGHQRHGPHALRSPGASAASARVLHRIAGKPHCPRCNDTGAVWVVCPDAGAVKLPCSCGKPETARGVDLVDVGLATAFVACCGAAFLLF